MPLYCLGTQMKTLFTHGRRIFESYTHYSNIMPDLLLFLVYIYVLLQGVINYYFFFFFFKP